MACSSLNTKTVPIIRLLQLQRWATSQNRLVPRGGVSFVRQRVAPFSVLLVIGITVLLDVCTPKRNDQESDGDDLVAVGDQHR